MTPRRQSQIWLKFQALFRIANKMEATINVARDAAKDAAKDVAAVTFPRAAEFTLEYLAKVCLGQGIFCTLYIVRVRAIATFVEE